MEISIAGVTKETGVQKVCDFIGIETDQVMAMGDNLNDYSSIRAAGMGVAVENADRELKEIADEITHYRMHRTALLKRSNVTCSSDPGGFRKIVSAKAL